MEVAIDVRGLCKVFGEFRAVDNLSLTVQPGEVFGLLGSNGAGKSTAIRMLCGLLTPSAGSASVLGIDIARNPDELKRRIGYMTQSFSLYDDLTVRQNIRFFGGVYGLRGKALADREAWAVEMAGLGGKEDLGTGELPGGWKQRLALACAVLHDPRLVFLDEPTGGVDPLSRRHFWKLIDAMAANGVTVIVTTHYLDEAERCDRIALMHAGRLIALGSVAELKEVFAGHVVLEVDCPRFLEAQRQIESLSGIVEVSVFGTSLHVVAGNLAAARAAIDEQLTRTGNAPFTIQQIIPSLEDVFIAYIERESQRARVEGHSS